MNQTSTLEHQRHVAEGRREALSWLAQTLTWEHRLDQLRPADAGATRSTETKQAA